MKLHTIVGDGRRLMCGPAAVSAITGVCVSNVKEYIYRTKGTRYVCRMHTTTMKRVLRQMGYNAKFEPIGRDAPKPTLAKWLKDRTDLNAMYLLVVGNHFIVVKGRRLVDNHTIKPVFLKKAPHRRKRVNFVYRITKSDRVDKIYDSLMSRTLGKMLYN